MGTERAVIGGVEVQAPPISRPMVMLYPREGSTAHNHSGTVVRAPWVTPERAEAAQLWLDFLHEDEQQQAFMASGFRPSTALPLADPISGRFGMDPSRPVTTVNPDRIDRAAARAILDSWDEVKRPGIVAFVADSSGSMAGPKLDEAKHGLLKALDGMARTNSVGLITFADRITARVEVGPIATNRFEIANTVQAMRAGGSTALYDAIRAGITMVDAAPGDEDAIRGVVVLTDGLSNTGSTKLGDLVDMTSRNERSVSRIDAGPGARLATEVGGTRVLATEVVGVRLAQPTTHEVQVFFIGIGPDADMEVGRILSQATGAAFAGATERDLATVLEAFGRYF
jgi:uncharacterized protein YegL